MHDVDVAAQTLASGGRGAGSRRSLRKQQTADLFEQLATAGEGERPEILQRVVLLNVGVARAVARRYTGRGIDGEDLEQTAYLALVVAARTFDPGRGHDFLTFAVPSIVGGVRHHFRDRGWTIQVPRRVQEVQVLMQRSGLPEADETAYGAATVERLADELELPPHEVEAALRARGCFRPAPLVAGAERARAWSLGSSPMSEEDDREAVELRAVLAPVVDQLAPRDRTLLRLRFGEDRTQEAIAAELHITQAQVSRLLTRVIVRLRAELAPAVEDSDVVVSSRRSA